MFKPCAIKEVTNPVQENVVRVGGDGIHTIRQGYSMETEFSGKSLIIRGVGNRGYVLKNRYIPLRIEYQNSVGGVYEIGTNTRFGFAILRGGSSLSVMDNRTGDVFLQYPE